MYKHELPTCPRRGSLEQAGLPSKQGEQQPPAFISHSASPSREVPACRAPGLGCGWGGCLESEQQAAVHPQLRAGCFVGQRGGWLPQTLDSGAGGQGGHASIRPLSRLGSPCRAGPEVQAGLCSQALKEGTWTLASGQSWGLSEEEQWSHCHPQGPISSLTEPDVRRKRDINKQPQGLWGQKWPIDTVDVQV